MAVSGSQKTRIGIGMAVGIALTILPKSANITQDGPFFMIAGQIAVPGTTAAQIAVPGIVTKPANLGQIAVPGLTGGQTTYHG